MQECGPSEIIIKKMDSNENSRKLDLGEEMDVEELELNSNEIFLYDIDLTLCRLCMQNNGSIEFLTNQILYQQIQLFTNIDLEFNCENLPKCICENCKQLLNDFHIFQQNCLQINERLTDLLQTSKNDEKSVQFKSLVQEESEDTEPIHEQKFIILKFDETVTDEQITSVDNLDEKLSSTDVFYDDENDDDDIDYEVEHLDYSDLENSAKSDVDGDEISKSDLEKYENDKEFRKDTLHFICPECNKFYTQKRSLKRHVLSAHPERPDIWRHVDAFKSCLCIECHQAFPDKTKLKRHVLTEHPEKPHIWQLSETNDADQYKKQIGQNYKCNACGNSYTEIRSLKRHVTIKHPDTPDIWKQARIALMTRRFRRNQRNGEHMFSCTECSNTYLYFRSLRRHALQSHGTKLKASESEKLKVNLENDSSSSPENCTLERKLYDCKLCRRVLLERDSFKRHLETKHPDHLITDEIIDAGARIGAKYSCTVDNCTAVFSNKENYHRHKYKEHGVKEYLCQKCGKRYRDIKNLQSHETFHLDVMPFKCPKCDLRFRFTTNLRVHIRNHHEGHRYYCSKCGRGFLSNCTRKRHELIHDGIKDFKCDECPGAFYTLKELKGHKRYHSDVRPHFCTICYKSFVTKTVLRIHQRSHTGEKPFKCTINGCMKSFAEKTKLYRHKRNIHHVNPIAEQDKTESSLLVAS